MGGRSKLNKAHKGANQDFVKRAKDKPISERVIEELFLKQKQLFSKRLDDLMQKVGALSKITEIS